MKFMKHLSHHLSHLLARPNAASAGVVPKKSGAHPIRIKLFRLVPVALGLAFALLANSAKAQSEYFTTAVTNDGTYSWDTTNWAATAAGPFDAPWTNGDFARFTGGGGISYTVTVNNAESMAGLINNPSTSDTLTINDAGNGTGSLSIVSGIQGFFATYNLYINATITGVGGLEPENGGNLYLFGTNTYSGGTLLASSSTLTYFNNASSFGSGTITVGTSAAFIAPILSFGGSPITLANAFSVVPSTGPTAGVNFASGANTPVICTGPWNLGTNTATIKNNGDSTAPLTLSGAISGTGNVNFSGNNSGTTILSGASTYGGLTTVGFGGSSGITLKVASINSVTAPAQQASSSLGKPSSAANGIIHLGNASSACTLVYTGAGETSDRVINLAGTTGGAIIEMDGAGPLVLTGGVTATNNGAKRLTLQGSSTAANTISGVIKDSSSGATTLVKAQAGKWVLAGANTYTGPTTNSAGTLEISGSINGNLTVAGGTMHIDSTGSMKGNLTVNGGTVQLDSATTLASPSTVTVTLSGSLASGAVNLNFSGAQTVNTLTIGGTTEAAGTWGSTTSGAQHTSAVFTGSGMLNVGGAPIITSQPQSASVVPGGSATFTVSALGSPTYQWKFNGANISGANASSYTISSATFANAGLYSCGLTNAFGGTVSAAAALTVRTTNGYTAIVLSDSPLAYWRLDEKAGTTAFDAAGTNNATYNNCAMGQTPGYSVIDSDACVGLTNGPSGGNANVSYVQTASLFNFFTNSSPQFTLEAWVNSTNFSTGVQRMFSCMDFSANYGYGFGIAGPQTLEFSVFGVYDMTNTITPLQTGVWYQLVAACDGGSIHFYVNGQPVGVQAFASYGTLGTGGLETAPMTLGADNWSGLSAGLHQEQLVGQLDECSIYGTFLGDTEVLAHYNAALPPAPVAQPVVADFPANYVGETTTFIENAVGMNLSYQWYSIIGTTTNQLTGETASTLVLSGLQPSQAGKYYCNVSNTGGSTNAPAATLTVLPIPTSASQLNITNGLVLHLPFSSDYKDISGRGNNGTPVGAPQIMPSNTFPSVVGSGSLNFSSGNNSSNYVTLGTPNDLLFSTNVDFTVAFWINQPYNDIGTNLPFFDNTVGSIGALDGYCIAPGEVNGTTSPNGAWEWSGGDGLHQISDQGSAGSISDGNWHHLAFVFTRTGSETTYQDGQYASTRTIAAITNFDTGNAINIAQDANGGYGATNDIPTSGNMDDLGVWRRALSALEVEGMYLAGISNSVSFAPVVPNAPTATPVTISKIVGSTLSYGGGSGSQFILKTTNALVLPGNLAGWAPLGTNTSTPGTFTIPTTNAAAFFYIQSK